MAVTIQDCRPEVQDFACAMETVLRHHDDRGKRGWEDSSNEWLLKRLHEELAEYTVISTTSSIVINKHKQVRGIIDVANFCMMIWDNNRSK